MWIRMARRPAITVQQGPTLTVITPPPAHPAQLAGTAPTQAVHHVIHAKLVSTVPSLLQAVPPARRGSTVTRKGVGHVHDVQLDLLLTQLGLLSAQLVMLDTENIIINSV